MAFTHLLFDLDGTLIDSKKGIFNAVRNTLDEMNIPLENRPENMDSFIGPPLRESFRTLFNFNEAEAEKAANIYRVYYSEKGLFEYSIYDGIPESLLYLKNKGFEISVVTSKAEVYARRIVDSFQFKEVFTTVSGCELNGERSSKKELIEYTLSKYGVSPSSDILMIGDRYHDIRGAKACKISSAGILYGYGSKHEIELEAPCFIIQKPYELKEIKLKYHFDNEKS